MSEFVRWVEQLPHANDGNKIGIGQYFMSFSRAISGQNPEKSAERGILLKILSKWPQPASQTKSRWSQSTSESVDMWSQSCGVMWRHVESVDTWSQSTWKSQRGLVRGGEEKRARPRGWFLSAWLRTGFPLLLNGARHNGESTRAG